MALIKSSWGFNGEKIFGSVHGYYGTLAKEPCEKRGGIFSYIIRHPVSRIHSAYIYALHAGYYKNFKTPLANKDIHSRVCGLLADEDLMKYTVAFEPENKSAPKFSALKPMKKFAKRILPDYVIKGLVQQTDRFSQKGRYKALLKKGETNEVPEERSHVGALFVALINEFLRHDDGLLKECSLVYGIKMEEMVRSSEYFKNCLWPRVAPQFDVTMLI